MEVLFYVVLNHTPMTFNMVKLIMLSANRVIL